MKRADVVAHLNGNGCFKQDEIETDADEIFSNCVNALYSNLPKEEYISSRLVIKMCIDLKIDVPAELEDDYHVFQAFMKSVRDHTEKEAIQGAQEAKKKRED